MGKIGILELCLIGALIFAKFVIVIGAVLWVKHRQEKKKRLFFEAEQRAQNLNPTIR